MEDEVTEFVKSQNLSVGHHRLICPCAASRKPFNRRERTLSIDVDFEKTVFLCQHCDARGAFKNREDMQRYHVTAPEPPKRLQIRKARSDEAKRWLEEERGISEATQTLTGVKFVELYGDPAVAFVYGDPSLHNAKIRKIEEKRFVIQGTIEDPYLWNLVDPDLDYLIIQEGECDSLSCYEAGLKNAISVPHGATRDGEQKLQFLDKHYPAINKFKRIILLTDNDEPGKQLAAELSRRLGRWRIYYPEYPQDCKDANEVLLKHGGAKLKEIIEGARAAHIPGLELATAFQDELLRLRRGEVGYGISTGIPGVDSLFKVSPGLLTVVTGFPSSGKSAWVDSVHVHLAKKHDWKIACWSAENPPAQHIAKLSEVYVGKRFHTNMPNPMSDEEMTEAAKWVGEHFFFITQEEDATPDSVIDRLRAAVMRYGIKSCVVDPYNYLSLPGAKREDQEISDMLTKFVRFCQETETHLFLVAHPRNLPITEIPNGNTIAGGGTWRAKADFGITIHRPQADNCVDLICWKVRHSHLGRMGSTQIGYDVRKAEYYDLDAPLEAPRQVKYSYYDEESDDYVN